MKKTGLIVLSLVLLLNIQEAITCTRVVYKGLNNLVMTARSMDWEGDIPANLWVFPRGMERNGLVGLSSVKWESKYGSLIATSWDFATSDGMNEKGLVANVLWLAETEYPPFTKDGDINGISLSLWPQYLLDNFATVKEAVEELQKEEFVIVSASIPGSDLFARIHLSVSDASGDNAIFEYIEGKLVIHHDESYNVMTNSPTFKEQLAIKDYWNKIQGNMMLPGTNNAADRFVRASYYIEAIPKVDDARTALAGVFSVIRNCSVPFGISTKDKPNISSTRWRVVSDQKNLTYYFENVLNPGVLWVELDNLNFEDGAPVMKLPLADNEFYVGEATTYFVKSEPFEFGGL